jgi:hemerythrin superfamily protein
MPSSRKRAKSPAKSSRSLRRSSATKSKGKTDAITLLKSDHQAVSQLLEKYETGKSRSRDGSKQQLAEQICRELTVHATIEEEIFYPAVAEQVEDAEDLVEEARVEHNSLKALIEEIESSEPGEPAYDAKVKVLGEYVKHHVKEEEGELFPKVRKSGVDLAALGEQLAARKSELKSE